MQPILFIIAVAAMLAMPAVDVAVVAPQQPASHHSVDATPAILKETWLNGRRVLWQQPATPPPPGGYPAILLLHGAGQHADAWFTGHNQWNAAQATFTEAALERDILVVAPQSRRPIPWGPRGWDAFAATVNTSIDLPFFQDIHEWLDTLPVNRSLLYCAGFSSGAFMTSRLARAFPDRFAAVAIHSGADASAIRLTWLGPVIDCVKPLRFPAGYPKTLVIHGRHDMVVPATCGINLYGELQRHNVASKLLLTGGGHIWQAARNEQMLDWLTGSPSPKTAASDGTTPVAAADHSRREAPYPSVSAA